MLVNTYTLQGTVHNTNMVLFTEYLLSKAACFSSENMYIQESDSKVGIVCQKHLHLN